MQGVTKPVFKTSLSNHQNKFNLILDNIYKKRLKLI